MQRTVVRISGLPASPDVPDSLLTLDACKLTCSTPDVYDLLQNAQQSQMPHAAPSRPQVPASQSPPMQPNAPGPRDQTNIDPAISGTAMLGGPPATPPPGEPDDDESPKSYGKRALSTSKRAAQNRAAQVCPSSLFGIGC